MKILEWFIKNYSNYVSLMRNCLYHYNDEILNYHHLEGDVWSHTMMAYQNAIRNGANDYVKYAILLHDIGRVITRKRNKEKEYISFGDFEGVSIYIGIGILNSTNLSVKEKIRVLKIVSYHYTIIDHVKFAEPSKDEIISIFKYEEELLVDLSNYVKCDLLGRIVESSKLKYYDINNLNNFINYCKNLKINKVIEIEKENSVTILVGPPCSQKSTFIKSINDKKTIVINRDSCVEEVGKRYGKHSYDESYYFMKDNKNIKEEVDNLDEYREDIAKNSINKNIIIDNPNLTIKSRKEWIDAFKDTHNIKVVLFLTKFEKLIICNQTRSKKISKTVTEKELINKLKTFVFPLKGMSLD